MMKVFTDIDCINPDSEISREPFFKAVPNPGYDAEVEGSSETIQELIPYIESRPFVELPDGTDLSNKCVEGGVLRDMTSEEISSIALSDAVAEFKAQRPALVAAITVDVGGLVFDGDEVSQTRMTRAAMVMNDVETMTWVLADNTPATVNKAQLMQALKLAGQAQSDIWVYS